ncbi:hypothetical protein NXS98_17095 [Fontisphaera persica]|uniref:hypothetical protein n=1 Tax=Fontisphaera persica TaxID=2974023 RepID=UPI0024C09AE8|nr:hypothetical protein [Fontisphaera persica]WCJ59411.1 hypothetical protein NXS98_17095 [Fontisphaera persica]
MLTQLPTLKARLGIPAYEIGHDALLADLIRFVTARFELECHRRFARRENASYDFRADALDVRVDRYPIESVSGFLLRRAGGGDWETLAEITAQISVAEAVIELGRPLGQPHEKARVIYTGGYVLPGNTPAAGQTALPDELEQAAIEQITYLFENRNRLGLVSVGGGSGAIDILRDLNLLPPGTSQTSGTVWFKYAQVDLLPSVRLILRHYTRLLW